MPHEWITDILLFIIMLILAYIASHTRRIIQDVMHGNISGTITLDGYTGEAMIDGFLELRIPGTETRVRPADEVSAAGPNHPSSPTEFSYFVDARPYDVYVNFPGWGSQTRHNVQVIHDRDNPVPPFQVPHP